MPTITLNIKSQKNTSQTISIADLKQRYMFGIRLEKDGIELPDSTYDFFINAARVEIEKFLSIKIDIQLLTENRDFQMDDWVSWSQVKATYPVVIPVSMKGYIGNVLQSDYPKEWLSVRKTSDNETYSRLLHLVPNSYSTYHQVAAIYSGFFPNAGWVGPGKRTPEYWTIQYVTGFKQLPLDIEQAIGMLASINVLTVGNETLASAMGALGTSSKSLSIDGLSQSVSMYVNGQAGIFGARIKQYLDSLFGNGTNPGLLQRLRDNYGSIIWSTC